MPSSRNDAGRDGLDALALDPGGTVGDAVWAEAALSIVLRAGSGLEALPNYQSVIEPFTSFCRRHNIGETVIDALAESAVPRATSAEVIGWLKLRSEKLASLHRKLSDALAEIALIFDRGGLTWRLMKGPHLRKTYFAGLGRDYFDLDLLVPVHQFDRARRALALANWSRRGRGILPPLLFRHFEHSFDLMREETNIDLHWAIRVRPAYRIDQDRIFAGTRVFEVGGVDVPVLAEDDDLLVSLLSTTHNIERGRASLRDALDLYFISRAIEARLSWSAFFAARRAEGTERLCADVLSAMVTWLDEGNALPKLRNALQERAVPLPAPTANPLKRSISREDDKAAGRQWYLSVYSGSTTLCRLHMLIALIANQEFPYNLPRSALFRWLPKRGSAER